MGVRTTVVGSWWIPERHEGELARLHRGELSDEAATLLLKRAAGDAILEQRQLGLSEWTGGEYQTSAFVDHLPRFLTGIALKRAAQPEIVDYDDLAGYSIVGNIEAPRGLGYLDAYLRERSLEGGVSKVAVVSPLEMTIHEADQPDEIHRQLQALIGIVNRELRAIADAGCPHVQLDAPVVGILVNMGQMSVEQAANLIAGCLDGVRARKTLHFCNGNLGGKPFSGKLRLAPWVEVLQRLEGVVDVALLECCYFAEWLERESLAGLPKRMELAAGIVSEASYHIEPMSKIRARAEGLVRIVGEDRLWLAPSCGLGRHPARDAPVLRRKVENLVAAAAAI